MRPMLSRQLSDAVIAKEDTLLRHKEGQWHPYAIDGSATIESESGASNTGKAHNACAALILACFLFGSSLALAQGDNEAEHEGHLIPFLPLASEKLRTGLLRVINHSDRNGEVEIRATDDDGDSADAVTLSIRMNESVLLDSEDLEVGNAGKGLPNGIGTGAGSWRLSLSSALDIEALSYSRTSDGYLTAVQDTVRREGNRHILPVFNAGDSRDVTSMLRIVNNRDHEVEVTITGTDDAGDRLAGSVSFSLPAGSSRTLTAEELESGASGIEGNLGAGAGWWQLVVETEMPLIVMNLLSSAEGHLANLSTAPAMDYAPATERIFNDRAVGRRLVGDDPDVHTDFLEDGKFRERESGGSVDGSYTYRHTGANAGVVVFDYDDGRECDAFVTFASRSSGHVRADCEDGSSYRARTWWMVESPADDSVTDDHGDTFATATVVDVPSTTAGELDGDGDKDYFRFEVAEATTLTVRTTGGTDTFGTLFDADRTSLDTNDDGGSRTNFQIEWDVQAGTHYVEVRGYRESTTGAYEFDVSSSTTGDSAGPDLVVESPMVDDNSLDAGGTVVFSATVRNRGDGESESTTLRYYRSSDSMISTSDTEVGTDSVGALAAGSDSDESITLTAPSSAGTYYYGACVDSVPNESDTGNNCSDGTKVEVAERIPDLVVESPLVDDNSPDAGGSFVFSATVRNRGDGRSESTTLRYYRSSDSMISTSDTEVGTDSVGALAAGSDSDESISLTAPSSAGTYHYGACVESVAGESDTGNNCTRGVAVEVTGGGRPTAFSGSRVITTAADGPYDVFAADLDGDGDPDVLSASANDDTIAWHENLGGGTFSARRVITDEADYAISVFAADLDGDGDQDVLSASWRDDTIAWHENLGGGTFSARRVITREARSAQSVFAADLDGDGDQDVLSASQRDDTIAWHENLGGGTFSARRVITDEARGAQSVFAADLDGDDDPDVLSASYRDDTIAWHENLGGGMFSARRVITDEADYGFSVFAADLDGDGDQDVLSASANDDTIAWHENLGGGTFSAQRAITTDADGARSVFAADLDGDGDPDVLSASANDDTIAWHENLGPQGEPDPQAAPDLIVESPSASESEVEPGGSVVFSATVRNRGDGESESTTLRYYRSSNSTISTSDTEVGTDSVGALASGSDSDESITLTAPSSAGTYYYGACVDSVSNESDTGNNCSDGVRVEVSGDDDDDRTDTYCREDDKIEPGDRCDIYNWPNRYFAVSSTGRGCLQLAFFRLCAGNSVSYRSSGLTLVAARNNDNSWTIDEVDPEPPN